MRHSLSQRALAEALGTALLLAAVVGSGVMAEALAGGNVGLALLANTIATGGALVALILMLGPISGAQFNPAVTLFLAIRREHPWAEVLPYLAAQVSGGILGVWLAHLMFDLPVIALGIKARTGIGLWTGEIVATAGLLLVIWGSSRGRPEATPFAVASWIIAAYWFTSSTSFANPAVTIARSLSPTFAGIAPADAPGFIAAQAAGVAVALVLALALTPRTPERTAP